MPWRDWVYANRHRGEVVGRINGRRRVMRLSLAALAQLETCYGGTDILQLLDRFSKAGLNVPDSENILRAGLAATQDELANTGAPLDVEGGPAAALQLASELVQRAFTPASEEEPSE